MPQSLVEEDMTIFHQQEAALTLIFRMGQMVTFKENESALSWLRNTLGSKPQPELCEAPKNLAVGTSDPIIWSLPSWRQCLLPSNGLYRKEPSCAMGVKTLGN